METTHAEEGQKFMACMGQLVVYNKASEREILKECFSLNCLENFDTNL